MYATTTISSRKLRRTLAAEVAIAILINGVAIPAVIWAVGVTPPATLEGRDGVIAGLAKATALPVFFMTLLITLGVHARLRKGSISALRASELPWMRWMPRLTVLRALVFTAGSLVVLTPIAAGVCAVCGLYPLSKITFAAVNIVYGTVVATFVTPFIVMTAMADK